MPKQTPGQGCHWYAIHTYSGYEENVVRNLKQRVESMSMEGKILNVLIPTEKRIKIKNGKRKVVIEKIFPGYVLVQMVVDDDSWYVVRNTPNVTGFIGSGTVPTPVSDEEMEGLLKRVGAEEPKYKMDIQAGAHVQVMDGPFKGFEGEVIEVDEARGKVKLSLNVFDRKTPVELDFLQVKKI